MEVNRKRGGIFNLSEKEKVAVIQLSACDIWQIVGSRQRPLSPVPFLLFFFFFFFLFHFWFLSFLTRDWECLQSTFLTRAERDDATTVNRLLPITPAQTLLSNTRQNITTAATTLSPSVYTTSQYQWNAMGQAHRISSHAANQTRNAIVKSWKSGYVGEKTKFVWQWQRDFAVDSWLYYKCRDKESRTYVRTTYTVQAIMYTRFFETPTKRHRQSPCVDNSRG